MVWDSDFAARAARSRARAERLYLFVRRRPSWLTRLAVGAGALVLAAITLLIIVPAILVMALVFVGGAAVLAGVMALRGRLSRGPGALRVRDGRENVRVIGRG